MSLTLRVYHNPSSFIRGFEAAGSNNSFDVDTTHMNCILGTAYDARGSDGKSIWMFVTHSDCSIEEDSEAYVLPPIAGPSQESEALKSPILLAIISTDCEKYNISAGSLISNAGDEISAYLVLVTAHVVKIIGSHLPQVYSAFGPEILVNSFLPAWSKFKSNEVEVSPEPIFSTTVGWISREKVVELYGNEAPPQLEDTDTNQSALNAQAGYFTVDLNALARRVDAQPEPTLLGHSNVDKLLSIMDQVVKCVVDFRSHGNGHLIAKMIINEAKKEKGRLWICLLNSEDDEENAMAQPVVMGYVYVGRKTPRTAAIRHVYTREEYRRMGVAYALVNEAIKWYTVGSAEFIGDEADVKASVTLFVSPENTVAVKTYSKIGFEIEQVLWEWRGFEGLHPGPF